MCGEGSGPTGLLAFSTHTAAPTRSAQNITAACDPRTRTLEQRCAACSCAMVDGIGAVLAQEGLAFDLNSVDAATAQSAIMACLPVVVPRMSAAGLELADLADLRACPLPECLAAFRRADGDA